MARWLPALVLLILGGCRTARLGHDEHHEQAERLAPLGCDLRRAWCAPVDDAHVSRRGTPYVHAFHIEPAFLGRDLLVHAEKEGGEHALEAEVEYALTRRLLIVAEFPYRWVEDEEGLGDVGLGLRGLAVETDRFLLSGQVGFEFPTAHGGLGAEELVVAPSLLAWSDLGCWFTAQAGATLAYGTESGDTEFGWGAVLTKSFAWGPLVACDHDDHEGHASYLSLFLEGRGTYALGGPEAGASSHEALFGASLPFSTHLDARAGWTLRWDEGDDATSGWVIGFVLHL